MNHTPGPWEIIDSNRHGDLYVGAKDAMNALAIANLIRPFIEDDNVVANARLIAAAPDLLAACKTAMEACRENMRAYQYKNEIVLHEAFLACEQAIQKASVEATESKPE